jgi:DNA-binding transcriptional LysR family regulator
MKIDELSAFIAVAESGSFSTAASQLYLTQPAVSKRVAALESSLGVQLFDRIGKTISLTEAGCQLLPRARQMLDEIADIQRALSNLSGSIGGTLSIGTSHHIGLHRLPPVLKRYNQQYPEVTLDIKFLGSEKVCSEVEHGGLELGIVTLPTEPSPNLKLVEVWHDPLEFVIGQGHPLSRIANPSLQQLLSYPAVLPGIGTYTRTILEQALGDLTPKLQVAISTNYLETLKMLVVTGLGWGLLPRTMLEIPEIEIINLSNLNPSRRLGIVTHRQRTISNAAQAMIESCINSN